MKKITLLLLGVMFTFSLQAQYHITSNMGDIEDGTVIEVNSLEESEASLKYEIHNDSDNELKVRVRAISVQNTDGEGFEFCLGGEAHCYYKIVEGQAYPIDSYISIPAGETQPGAGFDHFWNQKEEGINPDEPIVYVIAFEELDATGSIALGTTEFSYTYNKELSIEDHQKDFSIEIQSTLINSGVLNIEAQEPGNIQIFNLLGQEVKSSSLTTGMNTLDVANLSSQVYLVRLQNQSGAVKNQKIIIK